MQELTQRQEEIVDAAIAIIDRKGIQGLTIKNLSKDIGITEGAIYRHFENKREILISILNHFQKEINRFQQASQSEGKSAFARLAVFLDHFRRFFEANPAIVSVIFAEEIFHNDRELSGKIAELIGDNQHFILSLIREGRDGGTLRADLDEQMMVNGILGPFRLIVKKWKMEGFSVSLEDSLQAFLDYLSATLCVGDPGQ